MSLQNLYAKIGRNLICYQTIEKNIKQLLISSNITVAKTEAQFIHIDNSETYQNNTFGILVDAFFKKYMLSENITHKKENDQFEDRGYLYFSSTFTASIDNESHLSLKKQLKQIVTDRNKLVHNFIDQASYQTKAQKNAEELDNCYKKARSISDYIVQIIENRNKSIKYMLTDQFKLAVLHPEILECLSTVHTTHKNDTNWCKFSLFISEANKHYKLIFDDVKSEYQFSNWSYFLEKLGFIELQPIREDNKIVLYFKIPSQT